MENTQKTSKKSFFRKNIALIIILLCVFVVSGIIIASSLGKDPIVPPPISDEDPPDDPVIVDPPDDPVVVDPVTYALPVSGFVIDRGYSATEFSENITLMHWSIHKAVDFVVADNTPVMAIAAGKVISITTKMSMGTTIVIEHDEGVVSKYSSLSNDVNVVVGQNVTKGQVIGVATDSAYDEYKQGAHLHLEVFKDGVSINPLDLLEIEP